MWFVLEMRKMEEARRRVDEEIDEEMRRYNVNQAEAARRIWQRRYEA